MHISRFEHAEGAGRCTPVILGRGVASTRGPICGRPPACKRLRGVNRIACDHMSGLLSRSHMTAAKMVSATRVPNSTGGIEHHWVPRSVSRLGIDRSHHLLVSSKLPAYQEGDA